MGTFLTFCCLLYIIGIVYHVLIRETGHGRLHKPFWVSVVFPPYAVYMGTIPVTLFLWIFVNILAIVYLTWVLPVFEDIDGDF